MMKKLLIIAFLLPFLKLANAQEEIVKWTFPNNLLSDTVQNSTNQINLTRTIRIEGAGPITMTNGQISNDYAATAVNWNDGMGVKNWNIKFKTNGYDHIKISSKQRAGGNNGGPVDFKLQYKINNNGTWADVPGGTVKLGNDWTTGVIKDLDLPAECQNQSNSVFIRWIMTSNTDILPGILVTAAGISKIDDIVVTGMLMTGINNIAAPQLKSYPNPSISGFSIILPDETNTLEIYNSNGQTVYSILPKKKTINVEKLLPAGLYFIKATANGRVFLTKHIAR